MKKCINYTLFFCLLTFNPVVAQVKISDEQLKSNLKKHILTLSSDKFEGRETGKAGERLAYEYIISQFKEVGLVPKGPNGYLQPFPFDAGKKIGKNNQLSINKKSFSVSEDFIPLNYCVSGTATAEAVRVGYGIVSPSQVYDNYKNMQNLSGKIFIIETATPDGNNPHGKYSDFYDLQSRIDTAISKGASGIIFINTSEETEDPKADYSNKFKGKINIPVVFAKNSVEQTLLQDGPLRINLSVDLEKIELTGHNILGYIDNKAPNTIVIGAHYDHLGYGDNGSLYRGSPAIHNGADDNASGNAALIELARDLKNSNEKANNYLFIAFSGEEKGLLGSNYFVKNPTVELSRVNYMLNMDMIGRLKKEEKTLIISGTGTSPSWKDVLNSIQVDSLKYKFSESGVGPSDHTSFYLKDIPVLHFFSGSHEDYHKPSDDEEKINYDGAIAIIKVMSSLIDKMNESGKLQFSKTSDSNNEEVPRFKVTLGVVPDYAFDGEGMRIDGVSDGKPAAKAGLKSGDTVIQIGDFVITDMMTYMKALGKFSKGDSTKVKVKRENEIMEFDVTF